MADNQQYGPLAPKQTSASDIRSVIANATKKSGAGMTIATKDELNQKKVSNTNGLSNKNIVNTTNTKVNPNIAKVNNTKPTSVITPKTTNTAQTSQQQGTKMSSLIQGQISGDLFKNPAVQPINNVKVEQINGKNKQQSEAYNNYHLDKNEIKNMLKVETPEERQKRMSEGVEKLYIDAYRKKKDGAALTVEDVLGNANYQKELNGLEQGQIQEMVNDANTLANAGKFDMDNAIALFDKYQDLGISMDYSKLSPQSKAQFVGDILNNKKSTLGKIISWATPMGQISNIKELITGRSFSDTLLDTITSLEESSHKNLTDKDADKIAAKYIKELDEGFKDYYDLGKKSPSLVDYATNIKNAGDLYYKHKYGVDEDQKIWKDKDKEREYNEKLNEIRSLVKEKHGDTAGNVARNALIGSAKALLTVSNMASDLPGFGKMIWDLGKGGVEDFVGGVATVGKTAYDTAKYAKDTGDFEVQWDAKDIRQRVAEAGGYDNYNDFVAKVEQEMGDNPLGQFLAWSLKDADTSMDTANSLGNYFIEKYGTLDDGLTAFKNDPVEATSDWIPFAQFKIKLLEKLGLISSARANKIIDASRWLDAYDKPFELVNKVQFGPILKAEGKLLGGAAKLGGNTISLPFKLVSRAVDAVFSKLTGIDKESREFIRENGDSVLDFVNGNESSDGILREIKDKFDEITDDKRIIGEEYETIRNNDVPVKSKDILNDIYSRLNEYGVKITDKGAEFTKMIPSSIKGKVNELISYIDDFRKKGDTPSASDTHYFRQLIDNLTNWDNPNPKGLDAQFINTLKDIRKTIDNTLKEQVPGMREADAAYSSVVNTIKELRQDWFNKDGTLKDSAYSRIRNLTNKGSNQPKLERLESVIPGITQKLKSLAVAEVIERGMKQATGQYLNQIVGGVGIGALASLFTGGVSLPTLITGVLGMMYATPENFAHLLRFEGKITKPIRDIANKISNRTKLTAKETSNLVDFMLDNQERLGETAQYMYEKGLLDEPTKASDTKAPKSKDPTLKELTDYKESLKKDLKEGKITQKYYDDEIHGKNGEPGIDYAIAQKKARAKAGDKEHVLSAEDKERVTNFIKKRAKDVGFVTEMFENLPFDSGFTHLRNKLIAFSKNPGDTTAKHELFHAFFSVCDNKTKTYLIQEARKILKDNGMAIKDAEEWLAESFGIYAKRKMIDLGMIKNAPKGFVDKLRNFFQKVYEYMQRFNGDRATINKIFDEVLGEKQMKNGIMDLSDLLGDKKLDKKLLREIELGDNGLRNKAVYHGSPADFDKFDSSHMGEGEGAQAHGWGHYVAVDKKTAEHYANRKYSSPIVEYKGKTDYGRARYVQGKGLVQPKLEDVVAKDVALWIQSGLSFKEAVEKELEKSKNLIERPGYFANYKAIEKNRMKILNNLKESDFIYDDGVGKRNLYTNEIPDQVKADTPTGSNYLDEEGKLTDKDLNKFREIFKNSGESDLLEKFDDFGVKMLDYYGQNGKGLYKFLNRALGSDKAASKFLESIGYDGIHYFGGRDGEAYVIFNDDALQIKEHIRYKKKIGDKDVEITPKADSPDQLIEKNADGLSVMKSFISEKQAEKALDVNKALLDKDGNAYLWTHTNKYNAPQFANFESAKDSRYKEFGDNQIAFFSNSEEMSKSYADQKSVLANTKSPKNMEEFKKYLDELYPSKRVSVSHGKGAEWEVNAKTNFIIDKVKDGYELSKQTESRYNYDGVEDFYNKWAPKNLEEGHGLTKDEIFQKAKEALNDHIPAKYAGLVDVKLNKDGSVLVVDKGIKNLIGEYPTEKDMIAQGFSKLQEPKQYHYQGIAQDVKNPLVVDYRNPEGTKTYWNRLGTVYEFLEKTDKKQLNKLEKALDDVFGRREEVNIERRKVWDKIEEESHRLRREFKEAEYKYDFGDKTEGALKEADRTYDLKDRFNKYQDIVYEGFYRELTPEELAKLKDLDSLNQWGGFIDLVNDYRKKYKDYDIFGRNGIGLEQFLKNEGFSKDIISLTHDLPTYDSALGENIKSGKKALEDKHMQTNDYVFYALNNGSYDGVIFKNISDYGGEAATRKGGDVLTTFNSKQFKAWDNANPTDSKYISYKKKISLDKKSEGLQKKDSSGLLAKGRERTLGNDGLRYKTNISEKDSSGKKLSEGQKKFFAGSKVVDKDGNLLRVYHGTREKFTVFDNQKGKFSSNGMAKLGNWFTPSKEGAKQWAKENSLGMKPKAMEGYLDIKNPKIYEKWDATEHLKNVENDRQKLIKDSWKLLDSTGYNQLNKERYKKYFDKDYKYEGFGSKEQEQNKLIEQELKTLAYLSNDYIIEYKSQSYGTDGYQMVKNMREKGLSNEQIIKKANEAKEMLDRLENIRQEHRKGSFTDAYELFENDLRSYGGQTIKDRVGGSWMAMDDEAGAVKKYVEALKKQGYDGIIIKDTEYDGEVFGKTNDQYVAFDSNQFKNIDNKNPTKNEDIRYKAAWHGSPAQFDRFDSSHMGEGEGAQAHGWGHYVALDKNTAKKYAEMMDEKYTTRKLGGLTAKQWSSKYHGGANDAETYAKWKIANGMQGNFLGTKTLEDAKKDAIFLEQQVLDEYKGWLKDYKTVDVDGEDYYQTPRGLYPAKNVRSEVKKLEDRIKAMQGITEKDLVIENKNIGKRNLYELDIPDPVKKDTPTGSNYFEEGEVISPKAGKKIAEKLREKGHAPQDDIFGWSEGYLDRLLTSIEKGEKGKAVYEDIAVYLGGQKEASKFLESLGYDGIHYFGGRDGESYVLFNDNSPKIKNAIRYKKGLTAKDQTQIPEFKKWFEGSKVVDKSGKPLKVYHGTADKFTIFDHNKDGKNTGNKGLYGNGFYFTDYLQTAKEYGKMGVDLPFSDYGNIADWEKARFDKANVMEVYLDIKNPFYWKDIKNANQVRKLKEASGIRGLQWNDYLKEMRTLTDKQSVELAEYLQNAGYDGIIYEGDNGTEYAVFKSNQIKSATDNIGTFDKNNPDIRYKKGLEKKGNGLEKKRTTTLGKHSEEINRIASQLGVKGDNDMQKIKRMNKEIKDPKYQGTKIKKELYNLKWQIKKDYIIDHNKKIVDKGPKNTTVRVVQNGVQATWHFNQKQYKELKKMGVLIKNKKKRE